jgi:hypothetical protein
MERIISSGHFSDIGYSGRRWQDYGAGILSRSRSCGKDFCDIFYH